MKLGLTLLLIFMFTTSVYAGIASRLTFDSINSEQVIELPFAKPLIKYDQSVVNGERVKCFDLQVESQEETSQVYLKYNPLCQFIGSFKLEITDLKDSNSINAPLNYIAQISPRTDMLILTNRNALGNLPNDYYSTLMAYIEKTRRAKLRVKYLEIDDQKRNGGFVFQGPSYVLVNFNYYNKNLDNAALYSIIKFIIGKTRPSTVLILGGNTVIPSTYVSDGLASAERGGIVATDDLYAATNINRVPTIMVARVSTSPRDPTPASTIASFLKRTAPPSNYRNPVVIVGDDPKMPALRKRGQWIVASLKRTSVCNEGNNCYLAPPFCTQSKVYGSIFDEYAQECNEQKTSSVLANSDFLVFQTHGTDYAILDRAVGEHKYAVIATASEVFASGKRKFIIGEQCYATEFVEPEDNTIGRANFEERSYEMSLANRAIKSGATVLGKNGVSTGTISDKLAGRTGFAYQLLARAKIAVFEDETLDSRQRRNQMLKLSLIGDPLAFVDLKPQATKELLNS